MDENMRAELCAATVENAAAAYPDFDGAVLHSDRGSQYTSELYRCSLNEFNVRQSMNSVEGRCHQRPLRKYSWAGYTNEERAVLQPWQKKHGLHDRAVENNDMAVLHELLEQPPDMFGNRRNASGREAPQVLFCHGLAPGAPHWNKYPLRYALWIFIPMTYVLKNFE